MSKNIQQVYTANPITSNAATDLMYFGLSPYGAGNDAAMTYANFAAQFGAPYTPAALTSSNDTNVTITLGGTPATALLHAASITLGWTGLLSGTRGGTGVNNGSALLTYANNVTFSGNFTFTGNLTGNTNVTYPTSGTLATVAQTLARASISGTTQAMVVNTIYVVSNAAQTTGTLPATAAVGDICGLTGFGAAGWIMQANTGQTINTGSGNTSSGGSLTSNNQYDVLWVQCVVANTTWVPIISVSSGLTIA